MKCPDCGRHVIDTEFGRLFHRQQWHDREEDA